MSADPHDIELGLREKGPDTEQVSLEELRKVHARVRELKSFRDDVMMTFWNGRSFNRYASQKREGHISTGQEDEGHVSTTSTAMMSFLTIPGSVAPAFLRENRADVLKWLNDVEWKTANHDEPNVFTTSVALPLFTSLLGDEIDVQLAEPHRHAVEDLLDSLIREPRTAAREPRWGLRFQDNYPPSAFLTYWLVRALFEIIGPAPATATGHAAPGEVPYGGVGPTPVAERLWGIDAKGESEKCAEFAAVAVRWAKQELRRQMGYFTEGDFDRFDAIQMGYALAIDDLDLQRLPKDPDRPAVMACLRIFFERQQPNGLWPRVYPIYHDNDNGSIYPFTFTALTALTRVGWRPKASQPAKHTVEFLRPYLRSLFRALRWCEANLVRDDDGRLAGWRYADVLASSEAHAGATAAVFSFLESLELLIRHVMRAQILTEFDAEVLPASEQPNAENWLGTNFLDLDVKIGDNVHSMKRWFFKEIVQPHLRPARHDPWATPVAGGKVWSAILFGPPGTSKSTLPRELARALGWPLIVLGTADFLAQGLDMMVHQAQLIFRKLELAFDCVILVDEIEEFVRKRKSDASGSEAAEEYGRLATTAMLQLIQRVRERESAILIVATNHLEVIDEAIARRFDGQVLVPPPSVSAKMEYLTRQLDDSRVSMERAFELTPKMVETIERFTFREWRRFVNQCCETARENASAKEPPGEATFDLGDLGYMLSSEEGRLLIDDADWRNWKGAQTSLADHPVKIVTAR